MVMFKTNITFLAQIALQSFIIIVYRRIKKISRTHEQPRLLPCLAILADTLPNCATPPCHKVLHLMRCPDSVGGSAEKMSEQAQPGLSHLTARGLDGDDFACLLSEFPSYPRLSAPESLPGAHDELPES